MEPASRTFLIDLFEQLTWLVWAQKSGKIIARMTRIACPRHVGGHYVQVTFLDGKFQKWIEEDTCPASANR